MPPTIARARIPARSRVPSALTTAAQLTATAAICMRRGISQDGARYRTPATATTTASATLKASCQTARPDRHEDNRHVDKRRAATYSGTDSVRMTGDSEPSDEIALDARATLPGVKNDQTHGRMMTHVVPARTPPSPTQA